MKLTNKRTNTILVNAQVCSEWDYCNAALIEDIDEKTIEKWKKYNKIATELKNSGTYSFYYLSIWEVCTFLNLDEDREGYERIPEDRDWSYVTDVTKEEIDEQRPEQRIDGLQLKFYGNGEMCFIGYGKHTSEEFWSSEIHLDNL